MVVNMGVSRRKHAIVIPRHMIPTDGRGIPRVGGGHYSPMEKHDVAIRYDDGTLDVFNRVHLDRLNPSLKKYGGREGSGEFRHMTLEEGKLLGYGDHIWVLARDGSARRVKVNGAVKRWKREPDRIEVPFKYGMYEYGTFQSRDFGENGDVLVPL